MKSQSFQLGDSININYGIGGLKYENSYVNFGWHKIVNNNQTIDVIGAKKEELLSVKCCPNDFRNEFKSNHSYHIYSTDFDHLQFIINNGDTINYYDTLGLRQGLFLVGFNSKKNKNIYQGGLKNFINKCSSCENYYSYYKYKDDKEIAFWVTGEKQTGKVDTISYEYSLNDSVKIGRTKLDDDFYEIRKYIYKPIKTGENYPEIIASDTTLIFYPTGEMYAIFLQNGSIFNGLTKVFWKNGNLRRAIPYFDNLRNGTIVEYREDGTKEREYTYEKGKLLSEICFNITGFEIITCKK